MAKVVEAEAKTASCQCATLVRATEPEQGRCLIVCGAEIPAKHFVCRPCALGNHTGRPCKQHVPDYPRHLVKTCRSCGFDGALHERGSDGQLN